MRKSVSFVAALVAVLATAATVSAYGGPQTSGSVCGGKLVVNVDQKVVNDADSKVGGGSWALDAYTRHIQVRQSDVNAFCATVSYTGKFVTTGPTSPANLAPLSSGVKGTEDGGYAATFTASLLDSPGWRTHGSVGTFDYQCDVSSACVGRVNWLDQYFTADWANDFDYLWWGWQYKSARNGTWINSSDGNSGDIAD